MNRWRVPVLGDLRAIPKIVHHTERAHLASGQEVPFYRRNPALVGQNVFQGELFERRTFIALRHTPEKVLDLFRFGGYGEGTTPHASEELRAEIAVSNRHHELHQARLDVVGYRRLSLSCEMCRMRPKRTN